MKNIFILTTFLLLFSVTINAQEKLDSLNTDNRKSHYFDAVKQIKSFINPYLNSDKTTVVNFDDDFDDGTTKGEYGYWDYCINEECYRIGFYNWLELKTEAEISITHLESKISTTIKLDFYPQVEQVTYKIMSTALEYYTLKKQKKKMDKEVYQIYWNSYQSNLENRQEGKLVLDTDADATYNYGLYIEDDKIKGEQSCGLNENIISAIENRINNGNPKLGDLQLYFGYKMCRILGSNNNFVRDATARRRQKMKWKD